MKIVLIVILIFMIMLVAKKVSEQYKDKYDFYCNLHSFLCQFKINLSFKQEKIIEFLNSLTPRKHFKLFIEDYKQYLDSGVINFENLTFLDADEIENLQAKPNCTVSIQNKPYHKIGTSIIDCLKKALPYKEIQVSPIFDVSEFYEKMDLN